MSKVHSSVTCAVLLLVTTVACDDGRSDELRESEAQRLIESEVLGGDPPYLSTITMQYQKSSSTWPHGAIGYGSPVMQLTRDDKCWPAQPPAAPVRRFDPSDNSKPYQMNQAGDEILVAHSGVAPECPDVREAVLAQHDKVWYPTKVTIVSHRPKVRITEILTRNDEATITYTFDWTETELYQQWYKEKWLTLVARPDSKERQACLRKYDQGWRLC